MGTDCDKLTVCIRCKHYRDWDLDEVPVNGIQFSVQKCVASVKNRVDNVDLVSGEENHYDIYHYCDEINNGHCPKYERCGDDSCRQLVIGFAAIVVSLAGLWGMMCLMTGSWTWD